MKMANNFLTFLNNIKDEFGDKIALSTFKNNNYQFLSYNQLVDDSKRFAKFLIKKKNKKDFKVAILAENNIAWSRYAFGALLAEATIIPIDVALAPHEIFKILNHAEPDLVIYSENQKESLLSINKLGFNNALHLKMVEDFKIYPEFNDIKLTEASPNRHAFIVYTSGSSGNSKGVLHSEEAILFELKSIRSILYAKNIVSLSMLPINHMFEFTAGLCSNLSCGAEICIASSLDIDSLKRDLAQRKVTQMVTVPLLISKLKAGIIRNLNNKGIKARILFQTISSIAKFIPNSFVRRKLFSFIHKNLAPNLNRFIVGGAKTPKEDLVFFDLLGLSAYEGYGLTETAPVITTNRPDAYKIGSVGKAIPGIKMRINQEVGPDYGEIQIQGQNVMLGYFKNDELTKKSFSKDGWFKTGDIGEIDKNGFLKINGRIKSLIVLEGGKKIHPEEIEELFNIRPEIKDVSVSAIAKTINNRETLEIIYLLSPSDDLLTQFPNNWEEVENIMNDVANEVMKEIAPYKKANKIIISKEELPKTSTKKIKQCHIKSIIEELTKQTEAKTTHRIIHTKSNKPFSILNMTH
jgi:long-chain acyl-CoA synthetase